MLVDVKSKLYHFYSRGQAHQLRPNTLAYYGIRKSVNYKSVNYESVNYESVNYESVNYESVMFLQYRTLGLYNKTLRARNLWEMDRFQSKLMDFLWLVFFQQLVKTHYLTTDSVNYESVKFLQYRTWGLYYKTLRARNLWKIDIVENIYRMQSLYI